MLASLSILDLTQTDVDLKGFYGGFINDHYGYFVPYNNGAAFGKVPRVDLNDFTTVTVLDLSQTDVDLNGFVGGFISDGYGYLVPSTYSKVARISLM